MLQRIWAIVRKEFIHIRRDFRTLVIIFVMPIFMLFMYGYAINLELQKIELAVIDQSETPESSDFIRAFRGSKFFSLRHTTGSTAEIEQLFLHRRAQAVLIIPYDFARNIGQGRAASVQVLIDAADANTARLMKIYSDAVILAFNSGRGFQVPLDMAIAVHYNPALRSTYFFVPGLVALILMMISALLTSIAITREKETGTMEQMLVSPVQPAEIILGKVIPYIFMAFTDGLLILCVAHFWFEVPVRGSLLFMLGSLLLYIFVALALGLLLSTRAQTQQVAMLMALFATLLPTLVLSGFIFPIESMPVILQYISRIVPATYFLQIVRGVMLKGNTLEHIGAAVAVLALMGIFLTLLSTKRFRMTL